MAKLEVKIVKVLRDNYVYLLNHRASAASAVVDAGIAGPVISRLDESGWRTRKLFCTHHHADQIGGNTDMVRTLHCDVYGPKAERARIPAITHPVSGGDKVSVGDVEGVVLDLPGHTAGGIGYWFEEAAALFSGDILYPMGCGRLFECKPEEMWETLKRVRALPADTKVYCAHEYSERNFKFARTLDKDNKKLNDYGQALRTRIQSGQPGAPFELGAELAVNPFLRADDPAFQRKIGMPGADAVEVFAELRRRRDEV